MVKISLQDDILNLLKDAKFGLSVSKLAQQLNASRTTISKYLKILEEERKVSVQDIGQYKLWYQTEKYHQNKLRREALSTFYEPFYRSLLRNFSQFIKKPEDLKELGKVIAKDLNFSELTDSIVSQQNLTPLPENKEEIAKIHPKLPLMAQYIMNIIDSLFSTFDNYEWEPPVILREQNIIILRMKNSEYTSLTAHFQIFAGIIEQEMSKYIEACVTLNQIQPQNQIVDIQFQFKK
ncbi:MAG: HTH domain-containing protein [Promethearchaeota archaeon]